MIEQFHEYLLTLGRAEIDTWLRGKLDPTDLAQQTLLQAQQHEDQFQGRSDAERAAWLRVIQRNLLIDARRKFGRTEGRRLDVSGRGGDSAVSAQGWLVAEQSTPSQEIMRQECWERLRAAMADLPEDRRIALELKYFQSHSVPEIARRMGRSTAAVAGLLRRGLASLREALADDR